MRDYATYKVLWNRKNLPEPGRIEIEINLPNGKQRFISAGLKVYKGEWDAKQRQIVNSPFATRLNKQINGLIEKVRAHELSLIDKGQVLTWNDVDIALEKKSPGSFVAYMRERIDARNDIAAGTRYLHIRVANRLEKFKIIRFSDLTYDNIIAWDQKITTILKAQPSIAKHHQVVKTYINMATKSELIPYGANPYLKFTFSKGKHKIRVRLDDDEISKIIAAPPSITRDCAVFQIFTGVAHKDLYQLKQSNIRHDGKDVWLEGLRKKTGELYTVYLLPEAVEVVKRYAGEEMLIPCRDLHGYNNDLKILGAACGISKNLTTYVFRHTAATLMLRKGVPITTISSMMGHTDLDTTMIYAKLEKETMKEQFLRAFSKPSEKKPRIRKQVQPKRS